MITERPLKIECPDLQIIAHEEKIELPLLFSKMPSYKARTTAQISTYWGDWCRMLVIWGVASCYDAPFVKLLRDLLHIELVLGELAPFDMSIFMTF